MAEEKTIHTLADMCEAQGLPSTAVPELVQVLLDRETFRLAKANYEMDRCARRPDNEALPLGDFGEVEARIPAELFFNLMQQQRFGWEGLTSDDGIKDVLKDFPVCRVKTVSGRIQSGWTPGRRTVRNYGRI